MRKVRDVLDVGQHYEVVQGLRVLADGIVGNDELDLWVKQARAAVIPNLTYLVGGPRADEPSVISMTMLVSERPRSDGVTWRVQLGIDQLARIEAAGVPVDWSCSPSSWREIESEIDGHPKKGGNKT